MHLALVAGAHFLCSSTRSKWKAEIDRTSEEETLFVISAALAADTAGVCSRAILHVHADVKEADPRTKTPETMAELLPDCDRVRGHVRCPQTLSSPVALSQQGANVYGYSFVVARSTASAAVLCTSAVFTHLARRCSAECWRLRRVRTWTTLPASVSSQVRAQVKRQKGWW